MGKMRDGLVGRLFAVTRERQRAVTRQYGLHHLANLGVCPAGGWDTRKVRTSRRIWRILIVEESLFRLSGNSMVEKRSGREPAVAAERLLHDQRWNRSNRL
jgi:hypothetical protein